MLYKLNQNLTATIYFKRPVLSIMLHGPLDNACGCVASVQTKTITEAHKAKWPILGISRPSKTLLLEKLAKFVEPHRKIRITLK